VSSAAAASAPIGVLALQGDWAAHLEALARAGLRGVTVRTPDALKGLGGLVLPGGESTAMLRLIDHAGLAGPLAAFVASGAPLLATCAGLILSAREVHDPAQPGFGWLDVRVRRNGWGRQLASFVDSGRAFIRAPRVTAVGAEVTVLETVRGEPALLRQGRRWGATFHPELSADCSSLYTTIFGETP